MLTVNVYYNANINNRNVFDNKKEKHSDGL